MKICIAGMGKMGSWMAKMLSRDHEVFVYDTKFSDDQPPVPATKLDALERISSVAPAVFLNAVSLQNTLTCYRSVLQFLPGNCLLCDLASVKRDLPSFYREAGFRFVSIHPMFGPTFADLHSPRNENAVIISDSDETGKDFFRGFFGSMGVNVFEYSFAEHDVMMAYSLTLPFVSSMVFSSCVSTDAVPGTTFRKHLEVARGLLSEDDYLLAEIIFNPHSLAQIEKINNKLNFLWHIVKNRDNDEALKFFAQLRAQIHGHRRGSGAASV
jgi:prephenate dehydrogenase